MRRLIAFASAALLLSASCAGGGSDERTVLVDFSHDEFASFMIGNFPNEVSVTPGDTVVFKQVWTGEPHTVTGGTMVDKMMAQAKNWIPFFEAFETLAAQGVDLPNPEDPSGSWADVIEAVEGADDERRRDQLLDAYDTLVEEGSDLPPRDDIGDLSAEDAVKIVDEESSEFIDGSGLPWALDETEGGDAFVTQNAGQPCFLERGGPPKKQETPCPESQQRQRAFDGNASYYNSGIIPYEGAQGNTFSVELAEDIDPGSYFFYCAVHGPSQFTEVNVRPEGSEVPSQEAVSRKAREQISTFAEPMLKSFRDSRDGTVEARGERVRAPFAGVSTEAHGSINEFVPKRIRTRAGEEVTWKLMGADHTVSFDVPEYFPVIQFAKNGRVAFNRRLLPPAGGSPKIPEVREGETLSVDGGTYDGEGFFSSGLFGGEPYAEYTLRFSESGTYRYACLLHPPMVGTVEVS